jgi:hypothetical protein
MKTENISTVYTQTPKCKGRHGRHTLCSVKLQLCDIVDKDKVPKKHDGHEIEWANRNYKSLKCMFFYPSGTIMLRDKHISEHAYTYSATSWISFWTVTESIMYTIPFAVCLNSSKNFARSRSCPGMSTILNKPWKTLTPHKEKVVTQTSHTKTSKDSINKPNTKVQRNTR